MTDDIDNDGTTLHESGGVALRGFPPRILKLLQEVAGRNSTPPYGPWEDGDGEPLQDDADAALRWIAASPLSDGWQPIATAPHGRKLIVGYPNKLGNWRTVMACYYPSGVLLLEDEFSDCDDEGYAPEGWYEDCESQDTTARTDEAPTHWMPLPEPPTAEDRSQS